MVHEVRVKKCTDEVSRCLPLSVAIHHQQWMCYQLASRPGQDASNFLYGGDEVTSGEYMYAIVYS